MKYPDQVGVAHFFQGSIEMASYIEFTAMCAFWLQNANIRQTGADGRVDDLFGK
jgi:hypothetical protein